MLSKHHDTDGPPSANSLSRLLSFSYDRSFHCPWLLYRNLKTRARLRRALKFNSSLKLICFPVVIQDYVSAIQKRRFNSPRTSSFMLLTSLFPPFHILLFFLIYSRVKYGCPQISYWWIPYPLDILIQAYISSECDSPLVPWIVEQYINRYPLSSSFLTYPNTCLILSRFFNYLSSPLKSFLTCELTATLLVTFKLAKSRMLPDSFRMALLYQSFI